MTTESAVAKVLELSEEERYRIALKLLASVNTDLPLSDAWKAEIERREAEHEGHPNQVTPHDVVRDRVLTQLRQK
jgi:putative addiction module component (TIGR02574 family)